MIRSSRLAEPQFVVALDMADPRAWDSIAGTLIEAMAAARESTTSAFWDLVFCRRLMISAISVHVTAKALTSSAAATNTCRLIPSAPCDGLTRHKISDRWRERACNSYSILARFRRRFNC